ncbi:MAG TPA: hypothetical protein VF411_12110 [Bacteroidia bacterium]
MKKINLIIILIIVSISLKSQQTCTGIKMVVDYSHFTITGINHDSIFVKYLQFDISDTTGVFKISYTISDLTDASENQHNYTFNSSSSVQDLTVANNCMRNRKNVKISLGYFQYLEKSYLINLKLYSSSNNLLSSTNFNFKH